MPASLPPPFCPSSRHPLKFYLHNKTEASLCYSCNTGGIDGSTHVSKNNQASVHSAWSHLASCPHAWHIPWNPTPSLMVIKKNKIPTTCIHLKEQWLCFSPCVKYFLSIYDTCISKHQSFTQLFSVFLAKFHQGDLLSTLNFPGSFIWYFHCVVFCNFSDIVLHLLCNLQHTFYT